jgi:hypothetical protein
VKDWLQCTSGGSSQIHKDEEVGVVPVALALYLLLCCAGRASERKGNEYEGANTVVSKVWLHEQLAQLGLYSSILAFPTHSAPHPVLLDVELL